MYRFLYNNYTFWIKKKKPKDLQGLQGPRQSSPPTNSSLICDHSPAPSPWPSTVPGMCQAYPCLRASALAFPSAWDPLPPNIPPLEFYWKVPCSVKFTLTTLIKFINSPPILAYPPCLLHFPPEYLSSRNILRIYSLPVSLLKSRGMWEREFHLLLSLLCLLYLKQCLVHTM